MRLETDETEEQWEANKSAHWESNEWAVDVARNLMFQIVDNLHGKPYASTLDQLEDAQLVGDLADVIKRTLKAKRDMQNILMKLKKKMEFTETDNG